MTTITIEDFLQSSWLGKHIEIVTDIGRHIEGHVTGITTMTISLLEAQTLAEVTLDNCHITSINIGAGAIIDRNYAIKFKNKHTHMADNADLTFVGQLRERIENYATNCPNDAIQLYIRSELERRGASVFPQILSNCYSQLEKLPIDPDSRIIRLMILYRMRRFSDCARIVHDILDDADEPTPELICACFFAQCKNGISAYFWLTQHFLRTDNMEYMQSDLWWYYLKSSVAYSSYEYLEQLMNKMGGFETPKGVESMAYLHALNNNTLKSIQLMDALRNNQENTYYKASDYGLWMLSVDQDNHYHRYIKAITRIISNNEINSFQGTNEVNGYVYDYIPDKGYGFIIGADLLTYFFNRENIISNSVMDEIKSNICAFLSVAEEKLVKVSFTRVEQSKRTYSAHNIF